MDVAILANLNERNPVYAELTNSNHRRQLEFLQSMVEATLQLPRVLVTHHLIKGFNSYAIAGLHAGAGEYRSTSVLAGSFIPPEHARIQRWMDDFLMELERTWQGNDAAILGAYALWAINHIHPFVNGNGRTARAFSYYVMCVKLGAWLPGSPIMPIRLRGPARNEYLAGLRAADDGDLQPLTELLRRLLTEQIQEA